MKKNYEKPTFLFHNFEVSQNVSVGCELISNHAEDVCEVYVQAPGGKDISVFLTDACMVAPPEKGDTPCYHMPSENYNVFTS